MSNKILQNEISHIYLQGSDLAKREQEVLKDAIRKTGFIGEKISKRSRWWTSKEIGAFFVKGVYKGKNAVLKIQGVKPTVSEIYMIKSFEEANKSRLIRPPKLYAYLPWDNKKRYEALILEFVEKRVVSTPATKKEVERFFEAYSDYSKNSVGTPWLNKPKETVSERIEQNFKKWQEASFKLYKTHPFRDINDGKLIEEAVTVLKKGYKNVDFEFEHGHFSEGDLYEKGGQIVLLSNLYWGFKPPLYDAVFGMHWFIYHLGDIKNMTTEIIEEQRNLWTERIELIPKVKANKKLYNLALLERAAAGLNLDALSIDFNKPVAKYLVKETRKQVKQLIEDITP